MNPPQYEVSQVALVVRDLDRVVRDYHDQMGWGPWSIYEYQSPWLHDLTAHGKAADFTWLGAEAMVGSVWMEVLQPLEGDSPFSAWLERHGDGVHHVGYEVATMAEADALHASLGAAPAEELMSAWCGDIYFYYMDTRPLITEVWVGSAAALEPARTFPER
jgi:methylmalonyl-CoA/ethylmalonyl-CoA epimerase